MFYLNIAITKPLISCTVTTYLICTFVFAAKQAFSWCGSYYAVSDQHLCCLHLCIKQAFLCLGTFINNKVTKVITITLFVSLEEKFHFDNTPMQYPAFFNSVENGNFKMQNYDIFLIFALNIDRGYTEVVLTRTIMIYD